MSSTKTVVGLCWYHPEQWERLKDILADRHELEDTYEEWRKNAHRVICDMEAEGKTIKKVNINIEELLAWCNEKGYPVNGKSRSEYVSYVLQQKYKKL